MLWTTSTGSRAYAAYREHAATSARGTVTRDNLAPRTLGRWGG
jgi:hypothetical protein